MNKLRLSKGKKRECDKKCQIGVVFIVIGLFLFLLSGLLIEDIIIKITYLVLGLLMMIIGAGLYVLGASTTDKNIQQDINIFIGKQLFEKGTQAFVLGVVLGIFTKLIK